MGCWGRAEVCSIPGQTGPGGWGWRPHLNATVGMPMEGGCPVCVPQVCAPTSYITPGHGYSPRSQSCLSIALLGVEASVPWVPPPTGGTVRLCNQKSLLHTF